MEVFFYKRALKQLEKIRKKGRPQSAEVLKDIETLSQYPDVRALQVKKLKGEYARFFCLKTHGFRVKFTLENDEIHIIDIKDRKDAYK